MRVEEERKVIRSGNVSEDVLDNRRYYINYQLNLLATVTRFGFWALEGLSFKAQYIIKNPQLGKKVEGLAKEFGDYISELALFYGRMLTSTEPISFSAEKDIWMGRTLGNNPLEEIYKKWEEYNPENSLKEFLVRNLKLRESALRAKGQYFGILEDWILKPWLLDRSDLYEKKEPQVFIPEGISSLRLEQINQIKRMLGYHFRIHFPEGVVILVNLVSALPDAALIASWIKSSRRSKRVIFTFYRFSPFVEAHRGIEFWPLEEQLLVEGMKSNLPILAVDSFGSTGNTVLNTFEFFIKKMGEIAQENSLNQPPFYFLLNSFSFDAEDLIQKMPGVKISIITSRKIPVRLALFRSSS